MIFRYGIYFLSIIIDVNLKNSHRTYLPIYVNCISIKYIYSEEHEILRTDSIRVLLLNNKHQTTRKVHEENIPEIAKYMYF